MAENTEIIVSGERGLRARLVEDEDGVTVHFYNGMHELSQGEPIDWMDRGEWDAFKGRIDRAFGVLISGEV